VILLVLIFTLFFLQNNLSSNGLCVYLLPYYLIEISYLNARGAKDLRKGRKIIAHIKSYPISFTPEALHYCSQKHADMSPTSERLHYNY
jgi:hypothetical protein